MCVAVRRVLRRFNVVTWAALLGASGAVLVILGASQDDDYGGAVLLEIGAALFLAIPFVLLEDVIDKAETSLRQDVNEARTQIGELGEATAARLAAARHADSEAARALREDATEPNTWMLLRRAHDLASLDPRGVRVSLPDSSLRIRFTAERASADDQGAGVVLLAVEEADGERLAGSEMWSPQEPADEALTRLADELQRAGRYPGDGSWDADAIFDTLANTLERVVNMRTGGLEGAHLAPVIEVEGEWALTVEGLANIGDDRRRMPARRLLSERDHSRTVLMGAEATGGGTEQFERAFATAVAYYSGEDRRAAQSRLVRPS